LRCSILCDSVARKIKEYDETKIILISSHDLGDELLRELYDGKHITRYIENRKANPFKIFA
jgi:hypothetical protein